MKLTFSVLLSLWCGSAFCDPTYIGSNLSAINTQLAATNALEFHLLRCNDRACRPCEFTAWGAPFGNFIHQKEKGGNPATTEGIGGALIGFDYQRQRWLIGTSLGYSYGDVHYRGSQNNTTLHEEVACIYSNFSLDVLWVNVALWGGAYQSHNKRIISRSNTQGALFTPHLEIAAHKIGRNQNLEPFVRVDWVNNWQNRLTEKGDSGANLVVPGFHNSLVRSEAGFRFYETVYFWEGHLFFEQKLSYVNRNPLHMNNVNTRFATSPTSFPIAIGSDEVQHLGSVELTAYFKTNSCAPYLLLDLQGEFGGRFQSYFLSFEIGQNF